MLKSHLVCSSVLFFACTGQGCVGGLDVPSDEGVKSYAVTATGLGLENVLEAPQYLAVRKTPTALVDQAA